MQDHELDDNRTEVQAMNRASVPAEGDPVAYIAGLQIEVTEVPEDDEARCPLEGERHTEAATTQETTITSPAILIKATTQIQQLTIEWIELTIGKLQSLRSELAPGDVEANADGQVCDLATQPGNALCRFQHG